MRKSLRAGRLTAAAAALALALGAAGCRDKDNANTAGNTANHAGNVANITANAVSNATGATTDTALKNTVEANLTRNGVSGVTVEVSGGEVTLKGNIPRAKLQDAMKAANEANPKKVNNQLNLQ